MSTRRSSIPAGDKRKVKMGQIDTIARYRSSSLTLCPLSRSLFTLSFCLKPFFQLAKAYLCANKSAEFPAGWLPIALPVPLAWRKQVCERKQKKWVKYSARLNAFRELSVKGNVHV